VAKNNLADTIGAIAAIIIGGAIAAAILSALTRVPCPYCNKPIPKGARECPECHSILRYD
jgi:hypothetical protein